MSDAPLEWRISEAVDRARQEKLLKPADLNDILGSIVHTARLDLTDARWAPPAKYPALKGATRAQLYVQPSDVDAIDYFYNGLHGYRAAYAISEEAGEEANRLAVESVLSLVKGAFANKDAPSGIDLEIALAGDGVKVWVDHRHDPRLTRATAGERFCAELLFGPWLAAAERDEPVITTWDGKPHHKALAGILAPRLRRLVFRSAWVTDRGVVPDPEKQTRSKYLHEQGYA